MEVALIGPSSLRLRGKTVTLVVDPQESKAKIQADAVMLLHDLSTASIVEGSRLTMAGPGEYEVGGVKITGIKNAGNTSYYLTLDGVSLVIACTSSLIGKESLRDVDIAVLFADSLVDQSALATITNGVALFYGPQAQENAKALGKETQTISKYVVSKDKLPAEMEVVLLA